MNKVLVKKASRPKGQLVILSSPSGGGKTTICRMLLSKERLKLGWTFSISYTTRLIREGEEAGREYHFVKASRFDQLVGRDFFAEHFKVHLYQYGTPRLPIDRLIKKGGVMLLDVDVQGAKRLKAVYPKAVSIFILPPSAAVLKKRLTQRGTETKEQLKIRLGNALQEMQTFREYGFDYVVINDDLPSAVEQVLAIVKAHPCRVDQTNPEQLARYTGSAGRARQATTKQIRKK